MTNAPLLFSTLHLPRGPWRTVLDCLHAHFPAITREQWLRRMQQGKVRTVAGEPLDAQSPYREGLQVRYAREVENEQAIPFQAQVLFQDEHLLVVDKPHFLPVMPAGRFVEQTVLLRLMRATGNLELAPLHRIDRLTAGLVLFSCQSHSRRAYQALFAQQRIEKYYEALAAPMPHLNFPLCHRSRVVPGEPFFRMQEVNGAANSQTEIEVLERSPGYWRYGLRPITGRKHQLRVQMAGLGAPIVGDPLYPALQAQQGESFSTPLQLLARRLRFMDPLTGQERLFESQRQLRGGDPLL